MPAIFTVDHSPDSIDEANIRLDAAIGTLTMASECLKTVIFAGSDEATAVALTSMRLARMLFLEARADRRKMAQSIK